MYPIVGQIGDSICKIIHI